MGIGGFFCFDQLPEAENGFIASIGGDVRYLMSGRCAIYYALQDLMLTDRKRVAYLPAYTCETVIGSYEKAQYTIYYYDIDQTMAPIFDDKLLDEISVLALCGYYGFSRYDREFVARCAERSIAIIEDVTHSVLSADGIDPLCDYVVGSFRKWIGVPSGGFALKKKGAFTLPMVPPDETHLQMRSSAMEMKEQALKANRPEDVQIASDRFWSAEMMLRQMFDAHESDARSIDIINHYPFAQTIKQRRQNYGYLLEHLEESVHYTIVFPVLDDGVCPSHFTIYAADRDQLQTYLKDCEISTTAYWPLPPSVDISQFPKARYIYDHVLSIPCDQRYTDDDMQMICDALNGFSGQ